MTENRRIFWNAIATYGRSLYSLVIGLLCGRWTLMVLGEVDYGLLGLVGGLTTFIVFFNSVLSISVGRFFAFSVGASHRAGNEDQGLKECQRWFTVAVSIHTVVPMVLMLIGYPIGSWAISNYLTIPADRVSDCIWVFRFVCISCFLSMVSVPFNAMYTAKQYIAELTIYSFVTTTLNVFMLYYMVNHPGVWLAKLALWTCSLSILPSLIIMIRAFFIFKECRIIRKYLFNVRSIKELLSFAGWSFFGSLGNLLKGAGMAVLVNKMLGPACNAAANIASTVSGHTETLAGALRQALMPAITNARGAEDSERMISLVYTTCKFGTILVLPFAIPLALEIDEVMVLWLKHPPAYAGGLCIWLMAVLVLENMTTGHYVVIAANGKIALYQFLVGMMFILTLPIAWVMMKFGLGLYSVGYALLSTLSVVVVIRLVTVNVQMKITPHYWIVRIFTPIVTTIMASVAVGLLPVCYLPSSFFRVVITTVVANAVMLPLIWFIVLDRKERLWIVEKARGKFSKAW